MTNYPNGVYAGFVNQQANSEAAADEDQAENSDEEHQLKKELENHSISGKLGVSNVKV